MFEMLNEVLAWYKSLGFDRATIAVPLVETTVLLISLTICLLFRFSRAGLILAYLFLYRWGWTIQIGLFTADPKMQAAFSVGYMVFGILVVTFTVVGMLVHNSARDG